MSEFFFVTLNTVALDDSVTNKSTGWTGVKILEEILANKVAKFDELEDVDATNKADKQVVTYSAATNKYIPMDLSTLGESAGIALRQISKLGVVGTVSAPQVVNIDISSLNFKLPQINVLQYVSGTSDTIVTENTFSNGESSDFESNTMVTFDGTAHLDTNLTKDFVHDYDTTNYKVYKTTLDSEFKSISSVSLTVVSTTEFELSTTGVAKDRMLIPSGDFNLSNASNIDNFTLTGTGGTSGIKIICSADGGSTWKTFLTDGSGWTDIALDPTAVNSQGMNISVFNSISSTMWNLLITSNKIRFAYLLQDANVVDALTVQYDSFGYWRQAKDTEFDVNYASNTLLQVKLYISGDIKINY